MFDSVIVPEGSVCDFSSNKALVKLFFLFLLDNALLFDLNFLDIAHLIIDKLLDTASSSMIEVGVYEIILRFTDMLLL